MYVHGCAIPRPKNLPRLLTTELGPNHKALGLHGTGSAQAERMYSRMLEVRIKTLVGCPPQIVNSKERLATVWHDHCRNEDAVEMLSKAIERAEAVLSSDHQNTLRMKETLAAWLEELRNEALMVV